MTIAKKLGAQGGKARAANLSKDELSEIGRRGAVARWGPMPRAICGSEAKPLVIGDIEIPAYVLEDGRRVLAQRGLQMGLGFSRSGGKGGARRVAAFMRSLEAKGIDTKDLATRADSPVVFIPPAGPVAHGYEATILPDICAVIIDAAQQGALSKSQQHLARQAAILQHGFATLGIIALVDEVTGYIEIKRKNDYAEIIEAFVAKELRPWTRRFPFEFYEKIFALKGWGTSDLTPNSPKPIEVGRITDDLVYKRLAPAVRAELKKLTPRNEKGYLTTKMHRWLTDDIGAPKLEKHLAKLTTLMDSVLLDYPNGDGWPVFMTKVNVILPQMDKNYELPLGDRTRALPQRD
jgi:hypothetical protein